MVYNIWFFFWKRKSKYQILSGFIFILMLFLPQMTAHIELAKNYLQFFKITPPPYHCVWHIQTKKRMYIDIIKLKLVKYFSLHINIKKSKYILIYHHLTSNDDVRDHNLLLNIRIEKFRCRPCFRLMSQIFLDKPLYEAFLTHIK